MPSLQITICPRCGHTAKAMADIGFQSDWKSQALTEGLVSPRVGGVLYIKTPIHLAMSNGTYRTQVHGMIEPQ